MRRLPVYPGGAFALRHRGKKGGAARLDYSITMQRTNDESQSTFCICKAPGDRFLICCKAHLKKLPLSEDNISWSLEFGTAVKLLLLRSSNPFFWGLLNPIPPQRLHCSIIWGVPIILIHVHSHCFVDHKILICKYTCCHKFSQNCSEVSYRSNCLEEVVQQCVAQESGRSFTFKNF